MTDQSDNEQPHPVYSAPPVPPALAGVPVDIVADLRRACALHARTDSDFSQCEQFSKLMSDILSRLEDAGCDRLADRVMSIMLDCSPKAGSHCDKSQSVRNRLGRICPDK